MTQFDLLLFAWLGLTVVFTLLFPRKYQIHVVSLSTVGLLGFSYPFALGLMMGTSCLSYLLSHSVSRYRKKVIWIGVCYLFVMLILYKYLQTRDSIFSLPIPALIGMAYFFCRQIHFLVDAVKHQDNTVTFVQFLNYNFFLPVMFAGPIHRLPNFLRQCQRRRMSKEYFSSGLERVLYGYSKLIIGNLLIQYQLKPLLSLFGDTSTAALFFQSTLDWLYLYIQFSGYTDVALGFALLLGMKVEENFNNPLMARNIIDFWLRWHITLSSWCRDYVFTPVQALTRNQLISVIVAMVVMGLWHELSLYYFLWGVYHATGIAICRTYQQSNDLLQLNKLPRFINNGITRLMTFSWLISGMPVISSTLQFIQ